jgi:hypothetical protein
MSVALMALRIDWQVEQDRAVFSGNLHMPATPGVGVAGSSLLSGKRSYM